MRKSLLVMLLSIISLTCIIPAAKADITVTVVNTWGWEDMYAFVWTGENFYVDWPGQQMTSTGTQFRGYDVYTYTCPETYKNIIINNGESGEGNQTVDIVIDPSRLCLYKGAWFTNLNSIPNEEIGDATISMATLSHSNFINTFYGINAFVQAMNAASPGDTINLSAGAFNPASVDMGVVIRGVGINRPSRTVILDDISIEAYEDTQKLHIEGLEISGRLILSGELKSVDVHNCILIGGKWDGSPTYENIRFVNDIILSYSFAFYFGPYSALHGNIQFINCYVEGYIDLGNSNTAFTGSAQNCILKHPKDPNATSESTTANKMFYENCIIFGADSYTGYQATNSVFIGGNGSGIISNCYQNVSLNQIFSTFRGSYSDYETFELTPTAQANFLGTDGTQVGIYGGILPYDPTPTYPQIKTMNIGSKSNSDGMLDIEIEL